MNDRFAGRRAFLQSLGWSGVASLLAGSGCLEVDYQDYYDHEPPDDEPECAQTCDLGYWDTCYQDCYADDGYWDQSYWDTSYYDFRRDECNEYCDTTYIDECECEDEG